MGQKTNPIGNRLGIIKGWQSNWFGGNNFGEKVVEDEKIRRYLRARVSKGGVSKIIIERTLKRITVTINTSRPGFQKCPIMCARITLFPMHAWVGIALLSKQQKKF